MGLWDSFKRSLTGNYEPQDVNPPFELSGGAVKKPVVLVIESNHLTIKTFSVASKASRQLPYSNIISHGMEESGLANQCYLIIEDKGGNVTKFGPFLKKDFVTGYALFERLLNDQRL